MHNKFIGLFGLTLASLASSVNAATYNLADYFFPVQQGSSWIYVDQDGRYIRWLLSNVNYSQTLCNGTTRKVLLFDESQGDYVGTNYVPAESWQEYYSIATGYSYCGHSQDSPIVLMTPVSLQMNIGQSVSRQLDVYDGSCQHVVSSATVSIVEQTSVTFPSGGSYPDCLHLHFVTPNMVYDEWWARGVGIVKSVNVSGHNAGHTLQLISMTMTDLTKPVVSILSPTSGQQIKANSEQWLVKGTASDNVGVLQVLVNLNNTGWQPATGTTGWQILMNLQAGPNTVAAYAVDAAGNQSATSNVNFTYVLTAPLLVAAVGQGTINPNYSNAVLEIGLPYNVTAAGVNGHQFRRWEVATNWLNPAVVTNATLNFAMQSNLTLTVVFADTNRPVVTVTNLVATQRISNAVFTVRGKVTDNAGVSNVWYRLNGAPDWLAATGVVTGRTSLWSAPLVLEQQTNKFEVLEVWAEDTSGNRSMTNKVNFVYVQSWPLLVAAAGQGTISPNYSNAVLEIGLPYKVVAAGVNGHQFRRWEVASNWLNPMVVTNATLNFVMQANLTLTVVFADTNRPMVAVANLVANQRISNAVFTVRGRVTDNAGVSNVWYRLNGAPDWLAANGLAAGRTSLWSAPLVLGQRTNKFEVWAEDAAGNRSPTTNVSFVYVKSGPLLVAAVGQGTISPNYSNAVLEIGLNQSVKAAGVNGHQFRRWEVGTNWLNPGVVTNATLNFVMQSNLTLTVVFADTNRPVVTVTNLVANQRISNAVFTVRGKVTDNAGVSNVWYRFNGAPEWLPANGVVAGRTSLWSAPLVLEQPTNKFEVWAEDATGNRSATNSVSFAYVKMFTLTDYYPLPLGAYWLYDGTDSRGDPTKFSFEVTDTNYVITTYAGTKPVIGYTTNCVRVSAAYLDDTTLVPYENWNEYLAIGGRFGYFGDDDLPSESMRFAGGLIAPAQMAVGASVTLKTNAYMFGTNAGTASISFQLIERTNMTVPVGSFPDVLHTRWNMAYPGGAQVHDEWWAKWVGRIKRLHISGNSSAVSYELIQYSLPPAHGIAAKAAAPNGLGVPNLPLQFECCDGSLAVANRGAQMKLSGAPGAVVVVESSPDLVHWLPNQTNILTGGQMYFSDPQWTNYTRRFYRLRAP